MGRWEGGRVGGELQGACRGVGSNRQWLKRLEALSMMLNPGLSVYRGLIDTQTIAKQEGGEGKKRKLSRKKRGGKY